MNVQVTAHITNDAHVCREPVVGLHQALPSFPFGVKIDRTRFSEDVRILLAVQDRRAHVLQSELHTNLFSGSS